VTYDIASLVAGGGHGLVGGGGDVADRLEVPVPSTSESEDCAEENERLVVPGRLPLRCSTVGVGAGNGRVQGPGLGELAEGSGLGLRTSLSRLVTFREVSGSPRVNEEQTHRGDGAGGHGGHAKSSATEHV
jgi:hypothetical protein